MKEDCRNSLGNSCGQVGKGRAKRTDYNQVKDTLKIIAGKVVNDISKCIFYHIDVHRVAGLNIIQTKNSRTSQSKS